MNFSGLPCGENSQSASTHLTPATLPSLPKNDFVAMFHFRSQPSIWLEEVRSMYGHIGHGVLTERFSGGCGMIST